MSDRNRVLTTARLLVTTWLPGDAGDLQALHADPQVMAQMASGTQTGLQTAKRLEAWRAEHDERGWSKWRVEDGHGDLVGRAGFGLAHDTGHRELGYLLAPRLWGAGHATELARALVDWHFEHRDPALHTPLRAYVFALNAASRRVLDKVGFDLAGTDPDDSRQLCYEHRAP
jgi:RimJ/RimL family protein N-acetyltransferase